MNSVQITILVFSLILKRACYGQDSTPVVELCEIQNGSSHIIITIDESDGDDFSQVPDPEELPISGAPGQDISLEIVEDKSGLFILEDKKIKLKAVLDRDARDISTLMLKITCESLKTGKRRTIPLVARINDINDNAPKFVGTPYMISVPESTPVGTPIFSRLKSYDPDANINGQVEYRIVESSEDPTNSGYFAIDLPYQGIVTIAKPLDYETITTHLVTIVASDRASEESKRFSATTTLTIKVEDSDDLRPKFLQEKGYFANVISGFPISTLNIEPEKIRAEDQDTLRTEVKYSFTGGTPPDYSMHFEIDPNTGVVHQKLKVNREYHQSFEIDVRATELTGKFADTKLSIRVLAEDVSPPKLTTTSNVGFIDEGVPVGTYVTDSEGSRISFAIFDEDLKKGNENLPLDQYVFEMTSNFFQVDENGYLIVKEPNIDRDPPFQPVLNFQVFVRENSGSLKSSAPIPMKIHLRDVNDNTPILAPTNDITLIAGNDRRVIARLNATDNDSDKFITYKLLSVSNKGRQKFSLDPRTGVLEVIAPISDGEEYSLTTVAEDNGNLRSTAVVRVMVRPQPNLLGPVFDQFLYDIRVSEGAPKFTRVVETHAKDPEKGSVTYSIFEGNDLEHFQIEEATGIIRVMKALDRENITGYTLTVKATDKGGKFGTTSVKIKVTDENDNDPLFHGIPYSFRVLEGHVGEPVGNVEATDIDEAENSEVSYFIFDETSQENFSIEKKSGKISTLKSLDFESQPVHYVVIGAKDNGEKPRSSTATATVLVQDISDEVPYFEIQNHEAEVMENEPGFLVATVEAKDKDTEPSITYRLVEGDPVQFRVDPKTGEVFTTDGLDYERENKYSLVIGTEEGYIKGKQSEDAVTRIKVTVKDLNDIPPIFTRVPRGRLISIRNDVEVGEKIGSVEASDSDGTSPGNVVRFALSVSGSTPNAEKYFRVDEVDGDIFVIDDLSKEITEEYQLEIRAYDKGEPSLDSTILITVSIQRVITVSPELGIGFEKLEYQTNLYENAKEGQVIQNLPLVRKLKKNNIPIQCLITSVTGSNINEDISRKGLFGTSLNEKRHCNLVLLSPSEIDRELTDGYEVTIELKTLSAFVNPNRIRTHIRISIKDVNDNDPIFTQKRYFGTVLREAPPNTPVIQVEAHDKDFGPNGQIHYSLMSDNDTEGYFTINSKTGLISNARFFHDFESIELPIKFQIIAEDKAPLKEDRLMTYSTVYINIVDIDYNDIVLTVIDTSPANFKSRQSELSKALEEQSGFKVGIDRLDPAMIKYINGTCCKETPSGTDVYFHVIDPKHYRILNTSEPIVVREITNRVKASNIKQEISRRLFVRASDIHLPYKEVMDSKAMSSESTSSTKVAGIPAYPAIIIALAALLFLIAALAIFYLCCARRKLEVAKEKKEKMIVIPRYEPVFVEPQQKEYETQVLQMNVPYASEDFKPSNRIYQRGDPDDRSPSFNLDSISYITKEDRLSSSGNRSPSGSEESHISFSS